MRCWAVLCEVPQVSSNMDHAELARCFGALLDVPLLEHHQACLRDLEAMVLRAEEACRRRRTAIGLALARRLAAGRELVPRRPRAATGLAVARRRLAARRERHPTAIGLAVARRLAARRERDPVVYLSKYRDFIDAGRVWQERFAAAVAHEHRATPPPAAAAGAVLSAAPAWSPLPGSEERPLARALASAEVPVYLSPSSRAYDASILPEFTCARLAQIPASVHGPASGARQKFIYAAGSAPLSDVWAALADLPWYEIAEAADVDSRAPREAGDMDRPDAVVKRRRVF